MDNRRTFLLAALLTAALPLLGLHAADKDEHEHGPNGGDLTEVGDKDHNHIEIKHDEKAGTLTLWVVAKDAKTIVVIKDAPKLNMKSKAGNKQIEMKAAGDKWEATDDVLKEEPDGRVQIVIAEKKYNVKLEHHHH